jgi:hypothetical protein
MGTDLKSVPGRAVEMRDIFGWMCDPLVMDAMAHAHPERRKM